MREHMRTRVLRTVRRGNGSRELRYEGCGRREKSRREEEEEGPLPMYEAINLARQIASSLVRSQANC